MATEMNPLYRGNSRLITVTIKDADNLPVDISADTLVLTVKKTHCTDATYLLQVTNSATPPDTPHLDPVNGKTQFSISGDDSALFTSRSVAVEVTWFAGADAITVVDATLPIVEPVRIPV